MIVFIQYSYIHSYDLLARWREIQKCQIVSVVKYGFKSEWICLRPRERQNKDDYNDNENNNDNRLVFLFNENALQKKNIPAA